MRIALRILLGLAIAGGVVWAVVAAQNRETRLLVTFIDVGQGDSILIQVPGGKAWLVDAGGSIVDYLKLRDVSSLEAVVITHAHEDHISGMAEVLKEFPTSLVLDSGFPHTSETYADLLKLVAEKHIPYSVARAGQSYACDDLSIQVLHPVEPFITDTESDANNNSVVLRLTYGQTTFLLCADIQSEAEAQILKRGAFLSVQVLKVAHHGADTSTTQEFVDAVKPQQAVISVGAGNEYGHPSQKVVERLKSAGAQVLRTDEVGTIIFASDGQTLTRLAASNEPFYVGNRNSRLFHRPSCKNQPSEKNRVQFQTRDEALAAGYRAARCCRP